MTPHPWMRGRHQLYRSLSEGEEEELETAPQSRRSPDDGRWAWGRLVDLTSGLWRADTDTQHACCGILSCLSLGNPVNPPTAKPQSSCSVSCAQMFLLSTAQSCQQVPYLHIPAPGTLNWWPASWGPVAFSPFFLPAMEILSRLWCLSSRTSIFNFFPAMFAVSRVDRASVVLLWCVCCIFDAAVGAFRHFSFVISMTNSLRSSFFPLPASAWLWHSGHLFHTLVSICHCLGQVDWVRNTNGPRRETPQVSRRCSAPGSRGRQGSLSPSWQVPGSLCERTHLSHLYLGYLWSLICLARDLT